MKPRLIRQSLKDLTSCLWSMRAERAWKITVHFLTSISREAFCKVACDRKDKFMRKGKNFNLFFHQRRLPLLSELAGQLNQLRSKGYSVLYLSEPYSTSQISLFLNIGSRSFKNYPSARRPILTFEMHPLDFQNFTFNIFPNIFGS